MARKKALSRLEEIIEMEILGLHYDVSPGYRCTNAAHRKLDKWSVRVAPQYHRLCYECGKCIPGTCPYPNDGAMTFVWKEYRKVLREMPPDDLRTLRTRSAPPLRGAVVCCRSYCHLSCHVIPQNVVAASVVYCR